MTRKEFLARFKELRPYFFLRMSNNHGYTQLRAHVQAPGQGSREVCPITAVYYAASGEYASLCSYSKIGKEQLHLGPRIVTSIVKAADGRSRSKLQRALWRGIPRHYSDSSRHYSDSFLSLPPLIPAPKGNLR